MTPLDRHCSHIERHGFHCGAEPGDPCVNMSAGGKWKSIKGFHEERGVNKLEHPLSLTCLTRAERRIVSMLVNAKSQREIATSLEISINTLKRHTSAIYEKLHVRGSHQLVCRFYQTYYSPKTAI